ncbi:MAG: hypothetical protein ACOX7F_02955 [Eubacteriales bacterium]|jgi:stage III sporulation protein AG
MEWKQMAAFCWKGRGRMLYAALLVCVVLFWASNQLGSPKQQQETDEGYKTARTYIEYYEKRLEETLEQMEGVGRVEVLLTLEGGVEREYAQDTESSLTQQEQQQESSHRESTLVVSANGGQQPVLQREVEPEIRGVLVVCQGGGDQKVQLQVIEGVRTLLDVPASRIAVCKSK